MTVYLAKSDGVAYIMARASGPVGIVGDARWTVEPGQSLLGKTYADWMALPEGPHEIERE